MAVIPQYTRKAFADILEITAYYLRISDLAATTRIVSAIYNEIQNLANSPSAGGVQVEDMSPRFRRWTILNRKYYVYFTRLKDGNIAILRIYSAKRKPLKPEEILP